VKFGDIVERGQHVADIGSSGRSTGPHLHFEVRVKGVAQEPNKFLAAGADLAKAVALREKCVFAAIIPFRQWHRPLFPAGSAQCTKCRVLKFNVRHSPARCQQVCNADAQCRCIESFFPVLF